MKNEVNSSYLAFPLPLPRTPHLSRVFCSRSGIRARYSVCLVMRNEGNEMRTPPSKNPANARQQEEAKDLREEQKLPYNQRITTTDPHNNTIINNTINSVPSDNHHVSQSSINTTPFPIDSFQSEPDSWCYWISQESQCSRAH